MISMFVFVLGFCVCDFERENHKSEICVCDFYICVCVCDFGPIMTGRGPMGRVWILKKIHLLNEVGLDNGSGPTGWVQV